MQGTARRGRVRFGRGWRCAAGAVVLLAAGLAGCSNLTGEALEQRRERNEVDLSPPPRVAITPSKVGGEDAAFSLGGAGTSFSALNASVDELLGVAYRTPDPGRSYIPSLPPCRMRGGRVPPGRYDVSIELTGPGANVDALRMMLQRLLEERFGVRLTRSTETREVWLLVNCEQPDANLLANPPPGGVPARPQFSRIQLTGSSFNKLADQLEYELNRPVLNDTGRNDTYSLTLLVLEGDRDRQINAALQQQLRVALVPAQRAVEVFQVESLR